MRRWLPLQGLALLATASCSGGSSAPAVDAGAPDAAAADALSCAEATALWNASPPHSPIFSIANGALRVSTTSLPPGCDPLRERCPAVAEVVQGTIASDAEVRLQLHLVKAENPGGLLRFFVRSVDHPEVTAYAFAGLTPENQSCPAGTLRIGDCVFTAGATDAGLGGGCAGECRAPGTTHEIELRLHREGGAISMAVLADGTMEASLPPTPFSGDGLEVGVGLVNAASTATAGETTFDVDDFTAVPVNLVTPGVSSDAFDCAQTLE